MELKNIIRIIENFPQPGISFKDITPLLQDGKTFAKIINSFVNYYKDKNLDLIVGPEARGFLIGAPLAYALGIGFAPVRKPGKLPYNTYNYQYALEYGKDSLEIHTDAVKSGQRVLVADDLLATGGTSLAAIKLIEKLGGQVVGTAYIIELTELKGRELLEGYDVYSLVKY